MMMKNDEDDEDDYENYKHVTYGVKCIDNSYVVIEWHSIINTRCFGYCIWVNNGNIEVTVKDKDDEDNE